ncbi:isochorismate synthase [Achromobacter sp. KS-M25]|nr:isochorismate synthase [Achromobacter aestuarii]
MIKWHALKMFSAIPIVSIFSSGAPHAVLDSAGQLDIPDVVRRYRNDAFVFASPIATLIAPDVVWCAVDSAATGCAAQVRAMLAQALADGMQDAVVVGAVPFDAKASARLGLSRDGLRVGGLKRAPRAGQSCLSVQRTQVAASTPVPAPADYEAQVIAALHRFETTALDKVVLARTLRLELDGPLDLHRLLANLLARNVHGYTYAVPLAHDAVFLGATPELLVRRAGNRVMLNPLAGSAARCLDPDEDQHAARTLMASGKDLHEHAIMIDAIAQALRPLCRTLQVPSQPSLTATDALWHLSTTIEGELADPATTSLDLAYALHPTPAVGGYPTTLAQNAIAELESFDRGLFAGFVGWMDATGDGEWAVSLRCALCEPHQATLYAGAGIVPGSIPAAETAETQTKFRTMLNALGLEPALSAD